MIMKIQQYFYRASRLLAMSLLMLGTWVSASAEIKTIEKIELCPGDTIIYRGMEITHEGTYRDSMYSIDGSLDSIFVVLVSEAHTYVRDTMANWIQGNTYGWHGQTIAAAGIYYDYMKTVSGCDSTIVLHANFYPTYRFEETLTLCASELPYEWHGQQCKKADTYEAHYATIHGQDSMYVLTLKVLPTKESWVKVDICYGSVYYFNDKPLKTSGEYTETFMSAQGCDSICHLVLNVLPELSHRDTIYVSEKQLPIKWHNQTISAQGTYFEHHTTKNDCDSDDILVVNIWPTYELTFDTTVCRSDLPIVWQGQKLYKATQYTQFAHTIHGTDSIIHLNLNVVDVQHGIVYAQKCEGEPFPFRGRELTTPGRYFDTLPSKSAACDSIVELVLTNYPTYRFEETAELGQDTSIQWHGQTITHPGTYYDNAVTVVGGCDSVYVLTVIQHPSYLFKQDTAVCERDLPFLWQGKQLYTSGDYTSKMKSQFGTDSIYELKLTVHPTQFITQYVSLCPGETFSLRTKVVSQAGVYYDTIPSTVGCDSILQYIVSGARSYLHETDAVLELGHTYSWREHVYTKAGIYEDSYKTSMGCDSIYRLILHEREPFYIDETATICRHEAPYVFHGKQYFETNTYYDTVPKKYENDTIYRLHLTVNEDYLFTDKVDLCDNDEYTFRGKEITEPGVYYDSLLSVTGCDSVYMIVVNRMPSKVKETYVRIPDTEVPYEWHGQTIVESGTYIDHQSTVSGCDSIYRLHLTVLPTFRFVQDTLICAGSSYEWRGRTYAQSGTYTTYYTTVDGMDSVYVLNLTVAPHYETTTMTQLCDGDSFMFYGQKIDKPGIYSETLITKNGCDSVVNMVVNRAKTTFNSEYAEICEGDFYTWRGQLYTEKGTYFDTMKTTFGCDSIFRLTLNYAPTSIVTQTISLCEGEKFIFFGQEIVDAGIYTETLISSHGCDSTIRLIVNRIPSYHFFDTLYIDNQSTHIWHGQEISTSGTYTDSHTTVAGCDSIYTLTAIMQNSYHFETKATICEGETFVWRDGTYSLSGTYNETYHTIQGLDSIYTLYLTVYPRSEVTDYRTICKGETIVWRNQTITEAGIYTDTLFTKHGCDSIYNLVVNIAPDFFSSETVNLPLGQQITWRGKQIQAAGTYYAEYKNQFGCDSIYELIVNVYPTYLYEDRITICDNEGGYEWHGQTFNSSGIYYDRYQTIHGMDSIYSLHLTVNHSVVHDETLMLCDGGQVTTHGKVITQPGIYYDSLFTEHGCDSVVRLIVLRAPTYLYMDDGQIPATGHYEWRNKVYTEPGVYFDSLYTIYGCDSIYQLTLHEKPVYYYEEADTVCANYLPYMYHGMALYQTGTYYDSLLTTIGMDSVYKFQLTVLPTAADTIKETICQGDTYLFGDRVLTESGIYQQTLVAASGCDSTVTLFLNVSNIFYRTEQMTICDGATKEWHGKTINHGGFYYDSLTSKVTKCDSIYCLQVTMVPRFYQRDTVVICDKETPYFWQGNHYDSTGVYRREYSGYAGCDSIYELNLTVLRSYFQEQRIDFCQTDGASHRGGERFFSSRIILDTMPSSHGCDSIIKFVYVAHPSYRFESVGTINPGSKYFWHGQELTKAGYYEDKDTTIFGCDSTYVLRLVENLQYAFYDTVRICDSELPYEWHDQLLSTPGSYVAPYLTVTGADSIYHLELIINSTKLTELQDSMCTGGSYFWGDEEITETGTYLRHFNTMHGCDSVVSLTINFLPTYNYVEEISISDKESYMWQGTTYSKPGTYTKRVPSQSGCDSVYTLVLTILPTFYNEDTVFICQNDEPYFWHGNYYHETGIFYDSHKTQYGRDSIYCLNLTVYPSFHEEKRFDICKGDAVTFLGKEYSEAGVYTEQFYTSHGCDSIYTIVVNYLPSYQFDTYAKFCRGDRYEWREKIYTTAGIYREVFTTVNGCDSIYVLHLTMDEPFYQLDRDTVCSNEVPYTWHNKYIFETGTYFDSLKTELGCDSVYELRLMVYPSLTNIDTVQLCHGDTAYYRDSLLTETSLFTDTTYTEYGCPIVSGVVYNFWPTYHFVEHKTVCEGTEYKWHGQTITYEGLYFDSLTTVHGCDSIYELYLEMNSTVRTDSVTVICPDSLPFTFAYAGDTTILWRDTLMEFFYRTPAGCDSIFTFNLILTDKCSQVDSMPLCPGDSVLVENKYYKDPGQYSIPYNTDLSHNYPDSIYRFALYPARTAESYDSINLCTRDLPYQYNDLYLFESGHYNDTLQTVEGCDSIVHLTLVVRPMYFHQTQINLCNDEFFAFRGEEITRPGRYLDTLITKEGCDSVVEYIVNRMPTFFREEQGFITKGGSYPWHKNGQPIMLNRAGVFYDSLRTVEGCDSVYRLILTEVKGFYSLEKHTMCESETPYLWHDYYLYESGTYFDSLMNIQGADSVYELRLTVNAPVQVTSAVKLCQGSTYNFNGRIITAPGIYVDTMFTIDGCDSIVRLIVNKAPTYTERRQYFLCPGETFHLRGKDITEPGIYEDTLLTIDGCDSIIQYLVNTAENYFFTDSVEMNHNSSYMWHKNGLPFLLTHPGVFYDSLKTIHGCDSIYRLVLTEKKGFYNLEERTICKSETPFEWHGFYLYEPGIYFDSLMNLQGVDSVYELHLIINEPTLTTSTVNLCRDASYDFNGRVITAPGIYDDTLMTVDGCDSIVRLIVNKARTYTERRQYFLCPGESFFLRDKNITDPGIYEDTLITIEGCDSIIQYVVNEAEHYFFSDTATTDLNGTYKWHKNGAEVILTESGVYYDSCRTIHGCDSVYELVLHCGSYNNKQIYSCVGDTVRVNDLTITKDTSFMITYRASFGCDSVVRYNVTFEPTYYKEIRANVMDNETYDFDGDKVHQPGRYYHYYQSQYGCDSTVCLNLTVNETYYTEEFVDFCLDSVPYTHHGKQYWSSAELHDTLRSSHGSDSIVVTHLTVHPKIPETVINLDVCETDSVTIRGHRFGGSMFQTKRSIVLLYDTLLSAVTSCDSIIKYIVNVHQTYMIDEYDIFCEGSAYVWKDKHRSRLHHDTIWTPGTYYDSLVTVEHGCDSIFRLHLEAASELYHDTTVLVCYDELPYRHPYNNHLYYNDTVFFDTLITAGGCQDIHRTHYRLTNHCTYQETHICVNEYPTSFEGNRIDKSGDYRFFKMTSTGLDSVIRVKAIDLDTYENYVTLPGIYCDSVVFDGRVYYMSLTNHPIYYKSEMGCDSVVYLTVTVNNSTKQYDPDSLVTNPVIIPDYEAPYLWHGQEYTQAGTYEHREMTVQGCDSTVWMRLTIVPTTYAAPLNYTVCAGDSIPHPFDRATMLIATKDIVLQDTVWNPTAQQSIIRTANVMVEYPFTIDEVKIPEQLCAEQTMSFDIDFTYDGTLPTTYTVEFMDSYVNFSPRKQKGTLTSAQIPISVTANGACVTPGDYHINITLEGKSCTQSKVTISQTLHVLYPSSVLESNWDNVVAIVNEKYNAGNWAFTAPFAWLVQDKDLVDKTHLVAPASSSQPYLHSDYLKDGDLVTAYLIRQGTSQPIATCPFVFHTQSYGKGYDVLCVPTRVPKKSPQCAIMANCTGSYAIYDLLGHAWHSGMLEGDQTLISMPPVTGYYLVVVTTPDNQLHTQKVMVY